MTMLLGFQLAYSLASATMASSLSSVLVTSMLSGASMAERISWTRSLKFMPFSQEKIFWLVVTPVMMPQGRKSLISFILAVSMNISMFFGLPFRLF